MHELLGFIAVTAVVTCLVLTVIVTVMAASVPYLFKQCLSLEQRLQAANKRIDELDNNLVELMKRLTEEQVPNANGQVTRRMQ